MTYRPIPATGLVRDYYSAKKAENPAFSYQVFAKKAGFEAKTYLLHVIEGRKPLGFRSNIILTKEKAFQLNARIYMPGHRQLALLPPHRQWGWYQTFQ